MILAVAIAFAVYVGLVAAAQLVRRWSSTAFGVTFHFFAASMAMLAALAFWPQSPTELALRRHVGAIALVLAAFPATAVLNRLLWRRASTAGGVRGETPRVLADATGIVLVLAASIVVLEFVYGVQVPGLLAGSGVVALVLGLALQDMLANLFAGIAL